MAGRHIHSYQFNRDMQRKAVLVIGTVLIASVAMGSAAFTSGSVDRTATVSVAGDDAAVTGLQAGSSDLVYQNGSSQLTIDFSQSGANGINGNANYTIGNKTGDYENKSSDYAFNITNNDANPHDYTLSYDFTGSPSSGSSVTFTAYDSSDSQLGTVASDSSSGTFNLSSGQTAYIVMEVDSSGADSTNDLSGKMTITAT